MEISNKTLTWLVVTAIAVSLIATASVLTQLNNIKGITGLAGETYNDTGNASVTISSQTTLRYSTSILNFGTISVNTTLQYCNITHNASTGTVGNTTFVFIGCDNQSGQPTKAWPLTLENAGSTKMNITLNFSDNAVSLIGGGTTYSTPPMINFNVINNETGSCTMGLSYTAWTNVSTANVTINVCQNLSYADTTDSLAIGLKLGIPIDTLATTKTLRIKAQGTSLD